MAPQPAQAEEAPAPANVWAMLGLDAGTCASLADGTYKNDSFALVQIIDIVEHLTHDGRHIEPPKWSVTISDGKYYIEACAGFHLALALTRGLHHVFELVQLVGAWSIEDVDNKKRVGVVLPIVRTIRRYDGILGKPIRLPKFTNELDHAYSAVLVHMRSSDEADLREEFDWVPEGMRSMLTVYHSSMTGSFLQGEEVLGGFDLDNLNVRTGIGQPAQPTPTSTPPTQVGRTKKEGEASTQTSSQSSTASTVLAGLLTGGACASLVAGTLDDHEVPTLQVLGVTEEIDAMGNWYNPPLIRLVVSDGIHFVDVFAGMHLALSQVGGEYRIPDYAIGQAIGFERVEKDGELIAIIMHHFRQTVPFGRMVKRPASLPFAGHPGAGYREVRNQGLKYDFSWVPIEILRSLPLYDEEKNVDEHRRPKLPLSQAAQAGEGEEESTVEGDEPAQPDDDEGETAPPQMPTLTPSPPQRMLLIDVDIGATGISARARIDRVHPKNWTIDVVLHDQTARMDMVIRYKKVKAGVSLEVGKVYNFYGLSAVKSVAKFCRTQHRAQLSMDAGSGYAEVEDDRSNIPEQFFEPLPLVSLPAQPHNKSVDVLAVIGRVSVVMRGKEKEEGTKGYAAGASTTRSDVWIFDRSLAVARLVVFDEFVDMFRGKDGYFVLMQDVVVDKKLRDKVCLKTQTGVTRVLFEDDGGWHTMSLMHDLAQVQDNIDLYSHLTRSCSADGAVANRELGVGDLPVELITVKQIEERKLGTRRTPDFFRVEGFVKVENEHVAYPGCASSECNMNISKMAQTGGSYCCTLCGTVFTVPVGKFYVVFHLLDLAGDSCPGLAFNTAGRQLFGVDATYMRTLMEEGKKNAAKRAEYQDKLDRAGQILFHVLFQASTETVGPFKGRKSWIAIEFDKVDE